MRPKEYVESSAVGILLGVLICWMLWLAGTHWDVTINLFWCAVFGVSTIIVFIVLARILAVLSGEEQKDRNRKIRHQMEQERDRHIRESAHLQKQSMESKKQGPN